MARTVRLGKTYVVMPESAIRFIRYDVDARRAVAFIVHKDDATHEEIQERIEAVNRGLAAARGEGDSK